MERHERCAYLALPTDHQQVLLLLNIKALVLNKWYLDPADTLRIPVTSRAGHAVWWAWVHWAEARPAAELRLGSIAI